MEGQELVSRAHIIVVEENQNKKLPKQKSTDIFFFFLQNIASLVENLWLGTRRDSCLFLLAFYSGH